MKRIGAVGGVLAIIALACLVLTVLYLRLSADDLEDSFRVRAGALESGLAARLNVAEAALAAFGKGHAEDPHSWAEGFPGYARWLVGRHDFVIAAARIAVSPRADARQSTAGTPAYRLLAQFGAEDTAEDRLAAIPPPGTAAHRAFRSAMLRRSAFAVAIAAAGSAAERFLVVAPVKLSDGEAASAAVPEGAPRELVAIELTVADLLSDFLTATSEAEITLRYASVADRGGSDLILETRGTDIGGLAASFPLLEHRATLRLGDENLMLAIQARPIPSTERTVILAVLLAITIAGMVVAAISALRRRASVTDLRRSEQRFKDFADAPSHWLWEMGPDLRFTFISSGITRITGEKPADFVGKTRREIAGGNITNSTTLEENLATMERHEPFSDFTFSRPRVSGGTVHLSLSGKPYFDEAGNFAGYRGTARDISDAVVARQALERAHGELEQRVAERTRELEQANRDLTEEIAERERAEAALRSSEEELRQAQKLRVVGQLTGGIAHDFNNLLAIITGNAEILRDAAGDDRKQIDAILHASDRGAELTQRLLAFSRRQTLHPRTIDLRELLEGMADMLRRMLGETIDLTLEIEDDLWTVRADPGQLENALINLAINARDAMPGGGSLHISARNSELDESYAATQSELRPGSYALVTVTDTGRGIPAAIVDQVFEPFFTTKDVGEGSGLGLSMVYGFAKQSEGHVTIKTRAGLGTSVMLYLPRAELGVMPAEIKPDESCPKGDGEVILVLEDDAELRRVTRTMLTKLGYRILVAADAAEAEKLLADGGQVDLLLSDVVLPGRTSGPQFAASALSRRPDLKVLFMSGYPDDALQDGAGLAVSGKLINKPFRRREIAQRLRAALGQGPSEISRPSKAS